MKNFSQEDCNVVQQHLSISLLNTREISDLDLDELRTKRNSAHRAARDLLNGAQKGNRDLSDIETRAFDTATSYIDELDDEIQARGQDADVPYLPDMSPRGGTPRATGLLQPGNRWRDIYGREPHRGTGGFKNIGEFVQAVNAGDGDKLRQVRAMNEGSGADGGFAVAEEWHSTIYDSGMEQSVTLDKVTPFPMKTNVLHIPAWDSADGTLGPIGRVKGEWLGELSSATRIVPQTRMLTMRANKLAMFIGVSSEAMEDSEALSKSIAPLMRNSLAFSLDEVILVGNGIAKPAGILNSAATIGYSRATAGTVTFADFGHLLGRLLPRSLGSAVWIVSPSVFEVLVTMQVAANSGVLAMSSTYGAGKLRLELLGHEVRISEKLPALGETGDVMLCDLSYYALGVKNDSRFEKTIAAAWTEDQVDFRWIIRADGMPLINTPFTPAGSGATLSPFVMLD